MKVLKGGKGPMGDNKQKLEDQTLKKIMEISAVLDGVHVAVSGLALEGCMTILMNHLIESEDLNDKKSFLPHYIEIMQRSIDDARKRVRELSYESD